MDVDPGHEHEPLEVPHIPMDIDMEHEHTPAAHRVEQLEAEVDDLGNPPVNDEHASNGPNNPPDGAPQFTRRRQHGYATVVAYKDSARVIRWEYVDEEHHPSPADILKQREWFKLGEWLAKLAISDSEHAAYFEMKRVSLFMTIILAAHPTIRIAHGRLTMEKLCRLSQNSRFDGAWARVDRRHNQHPNRGGQRVICGAEALPTGRCPTPHWPYSPPRSHVPWAKKTLYNDN